MNLALKLYPLPNITFCLLCVLLAGCGQSGPELGYVTGRVTLDGQPVPGVLISFLPKDEQGTPSNGETNPQGQYEGMLTFREKGVLVGDHDVTLEQQRYSAQELKDMGLQELPVKIPNRYRKRGGLAATVKSGKQEINFELTSDSGKPANAK